MKPQPAGPGRVAGEPSRLVGAVFARRLSVNHYGNGTIVPSRVDFVTTTRHF
jgi:hypothetical protein